MHMLEKSFLLRTKIHYIETLTVVLKGSSSKMQSEAMAHKDDP